MDKRQAILCEMKRSAQTGRQMDLNRLPRGVSYSTPVRYVEAPGLLSLLWTICSGGASRAGDVHTGEGKR